MPEVYESYKNQLFNALKDKVKGYVLISINEDTDSLYVCISRGAHKFEYGVFELQNRMLFGTWDAEEIAKGILISYKRDILKHYLKTDHENDQKK